MPRDYLSSFMKIGTIAFLVLAVLRGPDDADAGRERVHRRRRPEYSRPPLSFRLHHHCLRRNLGISRAGLSGTTPKMIDRETDVRPIGYGAMLIEGFVGVMALIAAPHPRATTSPSTPRRRNSPTSACRS